MVDQMGIEPTNPLLARQVLSQTELLAHILQNLSYVYYLYSAETLISWSAEPHHILFLGVIVSEYTPQQ